MQDPKPLVIYTPGYGNTGNSSTYHRLQQHTEYTCATTAYNDQNAVEAEQQLCEQLTAFRQKNPNIILIGSSLGGYWTNFLAQKFNLPCLLINPAIAPMNSLKKYGLSDELLALLKPSTTRPVFRSIFLGRHDESVAPEPTKALFAGKAEITWLEEGHRFKDLTPVITRLKKLIAEEPEIWQKDPSLA